MYIVSGISEMLTTSDFLIRFKGGVPWYTVDLDSPPHKRWTALITDKKTDVRMLPSEVNMFIIQVSEMMTCFSIFFSPLSWST